MWSIPELVTAAFSLLLVPVILFAGRQIWDRRRWKVFTEQIQRVARDQFCEHMTRDELRSLAAVKLFDAGFDPGRVAALLPLATDYAAGIISYEQTGTYVSGFEDEDDDAHG